MSSVLEESSVSDYLDVVDDMRTADLSVREQDYRLLFMWPEPLHAQRGITRLDGLDCAIIVLRQMLQILHPEDRERDLVKEARERPRIENGPRLLSEKTNKS